MSIVKTYAYTVCPENRIGENDRFWAACGLDSLYPLIDTEGGEFLLKRMKEHGTCRYMRNHHTLSRLCKDGFPDAGGNVYSEDENGKRQYHFEKINGILKRYLDYGIKPVVELDFLPDELSARKMRGGVEEGVYDNRSYPADWGKWQELLNAFVRNLADTFGREEVRTWYFEVWNEPDGWPVAEWPLFHKLYDVFVEAVKGVDKRFRVGGPGVYQPDFFRDFLEHVGNGTNAVTGKKGTDIDFLSYHIYGMSGGWLEEYPLIMPEVQRFCQQVMWIARMLEGYPGLKEVEFHLNEWGVFSNYEKNSRDYPVLEQRNSEFSACFFIKLADCLTKIRQNFGFRVNMLLYWGFCLEDSRGELFAGNRGLSTGGHVMKPIGTAHELLALMGDELLEVRGDKSGGPVGCMAAKSPEGIQLLLYHVNESDPEGELPPVDIEAAVSGIEKTGYTIRVFCIDRKHHNTYRKWLELGRPGLCDTVAIQELQRAAELTCDEVLKITAPDGRLIIRRRLPPQGIQLLMIEKEGEQEYGV